MQLIHILREYCGAAHLVAVRAVGLTSKEAMVSNLGAEAAMTYGWADPFPDSAMYRERWLEAEQLTNRLVEGEIPQHHGAALAYFLPHPLAGR